MILRDHDITVDPRCDNVVSLIRLCFVYFDHNGGSALSSSTRCPRWPNCDCVNKFFSVTEGEIPFSFFCHMYSPQGLQNLYLFCIAQYATGDGEWHQEGFALGVIFQNVTDVTFVLRKTFSFFPWSVKCLFCFRELWNDRFIFRETWSRPFPHPLTTLSLHLGI